MSEQRRSRRLKNKTTFSMSNKPLTCNNCKRDIKTEMCYSNSDNTVYLCKECFTEYLKKN